MTSRLTATLSRHGFLTAIASIALSTAVFLVGRDWFAKGQWALLYLLVILFVASVAGAAPAVLAAVLAFFTWNFFFLPPYHTLQVHDSQDWLALVAFLIVGLIVGIQAGRMREREARAVAREQETRALNRLSTAIVSQTSTEEMAQGCLGEITGLLGAGAAALFLQQGAELVTYCATPACDEIDPALADRARRALQPGTTETDAGGRGSDGDAPGTGADQGDGDLFVPVRSPSGIAGVLVVEARAGGVPYSANATRLVTSVANLVGAYLEREGLQSAASLAAAEREADHLKSSLLSSVSHELKTPLAALSATVSNLLESDVDWDEQSVRDELRAIVGDVTRLNNSIGALLDLSRLEAHAWEPRRELYELSDIIAAGIDVLPTHLRQNVVLELPEETPIVDVDFVQWVRVVQNLLENAVLYAGDEAPVTIGARAWNDGVRMWVEDRGPGIAQEERDAVFEKFYRGSRASGRAPSGTGLGLAITREIVRSHGGTIRVEDVTPHGARFVIALPASREDASPTGGEETA